MTSTKQQLGQFMTTNYSYILKNMQIPKDIHTIIEPFCGNRDLLEFINDHQNISIECYDIDPKCENTIQQDTLINPPQYNDKFVLTNPPYLARNKATDKKPFNKYDTNDLYKCFIVSIINDNPNGGIIIIPLNFISSIRKADIELREKFLNIFDITRINIFEEQVFDDTSYTVCSIQFELKKHTPLIIIDIYPSMISIETNLMHENNFMIGGHIYKLPTNNKYTITRLTKQNKDQTHTNILVKCIDDNSNSKISLSMVDIDKVYIDETKSLSARTYATLVVNPPISIETQTELVERFQTYLEDERKKYNSLFLCNYRESKDIARKRISFGLVYLICEYLLDQMNLENQ
jgi:hypothetical protein